MYIRIKSFNKQRYAYLVKNKRYKRKKNPKQIVVKYLGKIHKHIPLGEIVFEAKEDYFKDKNSKEIIKDLIIFELKKHGYRRYNNIFKKENSFIDLENLEVLDEKNKDIAVEMNEGFLTRYTLEELFKHKHKAGVDEIEQGKELANKLVSCGIKIGKDVFLRLFEKIHKA